MPTAASRLIDWFDAERGTARAKRASAEIIDFATRRVLPTIERQSRGDGPGLALGFLIVAVLAGVTWWMASTVTSSTVRTSSPSEITQDFPRSLSALPDLPMRSRSSDLAAAESEGIAEVAEGLLVAPDLAPVLAKAPNFAPEPASSFKPNPNAAPTVVFDGGSGGTVVEFADGAAAQGSAVVQGEKAPTRGRLAFDPARTVTQGTLIPAILETPIASAAPGFVRAVVSTDIRSYDGKRLLVPRSSRLIGQYRSTMQDGQRRALVIWIQLIRPDGGSISLAAHAGDTEKAFLGRFADAKLQSVLGGLSALGPSGRIRQGEPLRVFAAGDLDLSKVD